MTTIRCLTCTARIEAYGTITALELGAQNNWLPVVFAHTVGYLCEQCSKWVDHPICVCRDRTPVYFKSEQDVTDQL